MSKLHISELEVSTQLPALDELILPIFKKNSDEPVRSINVNTLINIIIGEIQKGVTLDIAVRDNGFIVQKHKPIVLPNILTPPPPEEKPKPAYFEDETIFNELWKILERVTSYSDRSLKHLKNANTLIKDLTLDSLDHVELIFSIEEEFNILIDDDIAYSKFKTIGDVIEHIKEVKN